MTKKRLTTSQFVTAPKRAPKPDIEVNCLTTSQFVTAPKPLLLLVVIPAV